MLWSQADGPGSILLMTSVTTGPEGEPYVVESTRIDRVDGTARPVLSVTPNGSPFPGKWIAWLNDTNAIEALYAMHGVVETRTRPRALGARSQVLVGPLLHDFDPDDASRPGPAEAVLRSELDGSSLLQVMTVRPDGSWTQGVAFEGDTGAFLWGSAAFLSTGERRAAAVRGGANRSHLDLAAWKRGDSGRRRVTTLFDWDGQALGSAASLSANDDWTGVTITTRQDIDAEAYALHLWTVAAELRRSREDVVAFRIPGGIDPRRIVAGRGPGGRALVLAADAAGRWWTIGGEGRTAPLDVHFANLGEPAAILWTGENAAVVVFASPDRGFALRSF